MSNTATKVKIKPNLRLAEPGLYRVIFWNDNKTTYDFVVESLIHHFDHNVESASSLTERIHEEGSAIVALLPHEIAEQKQFEIMKDATRQGFPLKVTTEPSDG